MQPLLVASSLRVDVGGIPAVDGLSLASTSDRLLVLGAARALFEAACGQRGVARGELRVAGQDPAEALRAGEVAGAPLDPRLPVAWTVRQYITWSASLAGHGGGTSRALAAEAIERLQLESFAAKKIGAASLAARRGAVIAGALATGAGALLVEDPVAGLGLDASRSFARIIVRALSDRRVAFFAGRAPLDSPIALAADEAIVVDGSQVVAQGAPAEIAAGESAFVLRVGGDTRAFVQAVEAQGARLIGTGDEPAHACMTLDLGGLHTSDVLRIALESNAVVLELRPLARPFA